MPLPYVNIHTHHPTGRGIELRTTGVHPWYAEQMTIEAILPLDAPSLGANEQVQAIGEIGLDHASPVNHTAQLTLFRAQLALARERNLPVVLHAVKAFEQVMHELAECAPQTAIFHGFIGSSEQAQRAINRGYYLSFGERTAASPKTIEALCATPLDRLFVETDDSPTTIEQMYAQIALLRGVDVEQLKQSILANYERIFTHG